MRSSAERPLMFCVTAYYTIFNKFRFLWETKVASGHILSHVNPLDTLGHVFSPSYLRVNGLFLTDVLVKFSYTCVTNFPPISSSLIGLP